MLRTVVYHVPTRSAKQREFLPSGCSVVVRVPIKAGRHRAVHVCHQRRPLRSRSNPGIEQELQDPAPILPSYLRPPCQWFGLLPSCRLQTMLECSSPALCRYLASWVGLCVLQQTVNDVPARPVVLSMILFINKYILHINIKIYSGGLYINIK